MKKSDCANVCAIVIERLLYLGFDINLEDESHDDVLDALEGVEFVRKE